MLKLLMSSAELRRDLGASARAHVRREYSWDIAADRADALLARLSS